MFGHQDGNDDNHNNDNQQQDHQALDAIVNDQGAQTQPGQDVWQPAAPSSDSGVTNPAYNPSVGGPTGPTDTSVQPQSDAPAPAQDYQQPAYDQVDQQPDDHIAPQAPAADANGLLDIKQQALGQLSPIVDHLDQSPEEKFRTTMMMIQATDNQALIHDAYTAAQAIPDEKAKAQALLDVINEINYFTQNQHPAA